MKQITIDLLQKVIKDKGYTWYENSMPNLIGIRTELQVPNTFNDIFCLCWKQKSLFDTTWDVNLISKSSKEIVTKVQIDLNKWLYVGLDGNRLKEDGKFGANTKFALETYLKDVDKYRLKTYSITTIPGIYYLNYPLNDLGTAVLVPDQHKNILQIGFHKNNVNHPALVQTGNQVNVWRDNDRDKLAEPGVVDRGYFGINIHGMINPADIKTIGKWSAGCQVFPIWSQKEEVLQICKNYKQIMKTTKFTYTLIEEKDLL